MDARQMRLRARSTSPAHAQDPDADEGDADHMPGSGARGRKHDQFGTYRI